MIAFTIFAYRLRGHLVQKSTPSELGGLEVGQKNNANLDAAIWIQNFITRAFPAILRSLMVQPCLVLSSMGLSGRQKCITINLIWRPLGSSLGGIPLRLREVHLTESASTASNSDMFPLVLQARLLEYAAITYQSPLSTSSPSTQGTEHSDGTGFLLGYLRRCMW